MDGGEAKQVLNLIEALEDLDDVQAVYANFDIPEEVMAALKRSRPAPTPPIDGVASRRNHATVRDPHPHRALCRDRVHVDVLI